ncbi:hypothetical protein [Pseudoponticoccus marisrubri]|uniref:Uncharacterized protein n=1 Tax=Pseudoponticoccus marisrubri TaxID=1685382 RepID=A0A0W7WMW5_9RHOB|nr:hypothetical protein [Pseudoponticoccus marisrubri]KUF11903.1 hypothetical protein AVJ23_04800 [Pseudoponticoccus marisrubri]
MDLLIVFVLLAASFAGSALIFLAIRKSHLRREAQAALAAEKGWRFHHAPGRGGAPARTSISDPEEGWVLTLNVTSSGRGGSVSRWTLFEDPRPALDQGMALLGPEIPDRTAAMADRMLDRADAAGGIGGRIMQVMMNKLTGGLGAEAADLRAVPGDGPGTLFATPGAEHALDGLRDAPELVRARAEGNEMTQPVILRGPEGLRIRRNVALRSPEEIERYVALCRGLSARLQAPA